MYTSTHGLAAPVTHACTQLYHISLGCLGSLPKVRAERKAVPSEILVKKIYIPDCKISHASFVLYFHLLLLRSFIRIRSFFFISWSLLSLRTVDAFPVVASLHPRPEMRLLFAGKSLLLLKNGGTLAKITILNRTELHRTSVNPFQKACFRYS